MESDVRAELSEREVEILKLVATGLSNKQIAFHLKISPNTVKVHLKNIFGKIGAASRTEAAMYAIKGGLIDTPKESLSDRIDSIVSKDRYPGFFSKVNYKHLLGLVFIIVSVVSIPLFISTYRLQSQAVSLPTPFIGSEAKWQELKPLIIPRYGMAAGVFEDRIYAIGGESEKRTTGAMEIYDPKSNLWTMGKAKPIPVIDATAVVVGGKIYIPGGKMESGEITDVLEIYDPSMDIWFEGPSLPIALCGYYLVSFEGKLYIFGGWTGNNYSDRTFVFDVSLDKWEEKSRMLNASGFGIGIVANSQIYLIGGKNASTALSMNAIYHPERDFKSGQPWEIIEELPEPRFSMGAVSIPDRIQIIGGLGNNKKSLGVLEYSLTEKQWGIIDVRIRDWSNMNAILLDTHVHIFGGILSGSETDRHLAYQGVYSISIPLIR